MKLMFVVVSIVLILANIEQRTQAIVSYRNGTILDAKEGDVPYIALIKVMHPHTGKFMPICAGAIISEYDVLTNAVCASACQSPFHCKLYVGRVNVDAGGTETKINSSIWHHTYREMDMVNPSDETRSNILDLGIIHTEQIQMSDTVQMVAMNDNDARTCIDYKNGTLLAMISGWGAEQDAGFLGAPKQHAILKYGLINCFYEPWGAYRTIHGARLKSDGISTTYSDVIGSISDMGIPMVDVDSKQLLAVGSYHLFIWPDLATRRNIFIFFPVYENLSWIKANMRANLK